MANSRARLARCRSAASAKVSPRPERISISVSISSPLTAGRELGIAQAGRLHLLEAVLEIEDRGIDDRELLLDPDREVGRGLEDLAHGVEIQRVVLWLGIG